MKAVEDPVLRTIRTIGLIPIVRADSADVASRIAEALAGAGVGIVEITMTVPHALDVISALSRRFAGDVLIGAGTITTPAMADAAMDAGSEFLVTPGLVPEAIARARHRHVPILAGALTPTEVLAAHQAGADLVKVFPANSVGGPSYLRALRGPFPDIDLVPTGGVNLQTVADYIRAGAAAVGVGGELIPREAVNAGNFDAIGALGREFLEAIAVARS